jgi:hypothetical protein
LPISLSDIYHQNPQLDILNWILKISNMHRYLSLVSIALTILAMFIYSCNQSDSPSEEEMPDDGEQAQVAMTLTDYEILGDSIVMQSQQALLKNLKGAIDSHGIQGAVSYCNIVALPIMEEVGNKYDVMVRRATMQTRNPVDQPTVAEQYVLEEWMMMHQAGEKPIPFAEVLSEDEIAYYAPIYVGAPLCLNCHGSLESDILPETAAIIDSLYPLDNAKGYELGDFRGMWSIKFENVSTSEL